MPASSTANESMSAHGPSCVLVIAAGSNLATVPREQRKLVAVTLNRSKS